MESESEVTKASSALSLFRERNFLWLWLAYVISNLGDAALAVALSVTVYNGNNSKTALGLSMMFGTLPVVLFGLAGGVFADRWNRRRTMITADLGRALAVLLLLGIPNAHFKALFDAHDMGWSTRLPSLWPRFLASFPHLGRASCLSLCRARGCFRPTG